MAYDVLAAPISTITSKSTFSTNGRVLDTYRSSLTPKLVQVFICMQDWLHEYPCFDAIEDDLVELEKVDLVRIYVIEGFIYFNSYFHWVSLTCLNLYSCILWICQKLH